MKIIEISEQHVSALHCPFCGTEVTNEEKAPEINPCSHTLFIATDEGFEYSSEPFRLICEEQGVTESEIGKIGVGVIQRIHKDDAVCFSVIPLPPAMLCLHVGFMPS